MKLLKERIRAEATVIGSQVLKVDHFLNHQVDVDFLHKIGRNFMTASKMNRSPRFSL